MTDNSVNSCEKDQNSTTNEIQEPIESCKATNRDTVPGNLYHMGTLGGGVSALKGAVACVKGREEGVDIRIINKLNEDIKIHLTGGKNNEVKELLPPGITRIHSKKTKHGLKNASVNYECEFWGRDKHAKIFVYGEKAPRKDNIFKVKEKGLYLVGEKEEFFVQEWDKDELDGLNFNVR